MKTREQKTPSCFKWLRAVRDKMNREIEGMTPEEWCDYMRAQGEIARKKLSAIPLEEADCVFRVPLAEKPAPSRRGKVGRMAVIGPRKAKAIAKAPARRRKAEKRLAHA